MLFVLRTAAVSIIMLLLFNPYFKNKTNTTEQASVIIAQDNSLSLILNKDSSFYKEKYPLILDSIVDIIDDKFSIDKYLFGNEVRDFDSIDYQDYYTDINEVLRKIERTYYKRNVGAVVLLSDGICNRSYPPEQNISSYPFPIYSVTLGDTTIYPDLYIKDVRYNKTCQANTTFPVQVVANAVNCKNKSMEVEILLNKETVRNIIIPINTNNFSKILDFNIDSNDEGVMQVEVRIKAIDNETQTKNNSKVFFIEVIDKQYKALCLAKSPHPDIAGIKNVLGEHFNLDIIFFNYDIPEFNDYDIVILHQVPFIGMNNYDFIQQQLEKNDKTPVLYIVGKDTDIDNFNKLQSSMQIRKGSVNSILDVKSHLNQSFGLFKIDKENIETINDFPPLSLPHLETTLNNNFDILLQMNIMDITTETPLLSFTVDNERRKTAYLLGTGIWRWKLHNYYHKKDFNSFEEIVSKTMQYLITEKNENLSLYHKESYINNEPVIMTAEIKNPSQEIVNDADLKINIINRHNNDRYEYIFTKSDNTYQLNINALPEGIYTYSAEAEYGNKLYETTGTFSVVDVGAEAQDLVANARRMESLSSLTNGENFSVDEIKQLVEALYNDERIHSIVREENNFINMINIRLLLFIILMMISIEWFLRKYFS